MKKKSFYFEDYTDYENNSEKNNTKSIKISSGRIVFLFFIFFSLITIFSIKIIYLSLFPGQNLTYIKTTENFYQERRDIIDRNGTILARNIDVYDAGIRPKLVKDKKKIVI